MRDLKFGIFVMVICYGVICVADDSLTGSFASSQEEEACSAGAEECTGDYRPKSEHLNVHDHACTGDGLINCMQVLTVTTIYT